MSFSSSHGRQEQISQNELVVAVDFGTTFTGVAYYHAGAAFENIDENDVRRIAEKVNVINTWPHNPASQYAEKTPTVLSYNTDPPTWGGYVRTQHRPQISGFKLGLEPNIFQHYNRLPKNLNGLGTVPQLPGKLPVDFTTDYLACVHNHVQRVCFPRLFGADVLEYQRMRYIVTIPAIWSDEAKALTRRAACRAFDVSNEHLQLITEPEAAALYCASMSQDAGLKDGDRFIVCDAGGGTVV
jgi:molecular chaperone DnaK (HSP70)